MSIDTLFRAWLSFCITLALSVALLGCPGTQIITETPEVAAADGQQATCKVAKDPLNPLIVEWPGTSKVDFDSASQRGVVFVSYVGCNLKVLSSCRATSQNATYDMTNVTPARDKVVMADQSELYARLPLGAASLKGELGLGSSLELDYIAVGQRIAKEAPKGYEGDCEGVTHFVRTITVGAYSLDARAAGKAMAGAEVGNAGGGLSRQESKRNIRGSGNVELCADDPSAPQCAAVLQLGLAPLTKGDRGQLLNTAGFAAGIGPLGTVVIPDLGELNLGNASFRNVDSGYLRVVDDALRAEKQGGSSTETKIQKWEQVRDARPDGEFRAQAEDRIAKWRDVLDAERKRREKLDLLRTRYLQDKQKLDELLAIQSEALASSDQKSAWKKEFATAYEPYDKELGELGLRGGGSSSSSSSASSYTPPSDSSSGGTDVTEPPKIGEEIFVIKGDFGMHAQGFSVDDDLDTLTGQRGGDKEQKPDYGLSGFFAGGHLAVNFDSDREMGVGVLAYGRYYVQATLPEEVNPAQEATGAFEVGGGLRVAGPIDDRVAMNLGLQGGVVSFLGPETDPVCPTADGSLPYDASALGGNVDLFLGFDFYPLSFLSLGLTGLVGWGHVEAQACSDVSQTGTDAPVLDVFGQSFSATATGHLGLHF